MVAAPAIFGSDNPNFHAVEEVIFWRLPDTVQKSIAAVHKTITDVSYGYDYKLVRFDFRHEVTLADVAAARLILEYANQRSHYTFTTAVVTALRLRTKSRAMTEGDIEKTIEFYATDLLEYPPDVVAETCQRWAESRQFFPAWAELKTELEDRVKPRRLMLSALIEREKVMRHPSETPAIGDR